MKFLNRVRNTRNWIREISWNFIVTGD